MTTTPAPAGRKPVLRIDEPFLAEPTHEETSRHRAYRFTLAAIRLSIGWVFVWAFLDKMFGLGHETPSSGAWIDRGSPTAGFLGKATAGPFSDFYHSFAGAGWADALFMTALIGIGSALVLGIALRAAAAAGATLLVMMWTAVLPPGNNPFMDDHLIYALVLVVLALAGAGKTLGLGRVWEQIPVVYRHGFLK